MSVMTIESARRQTDAAKTMDVLEEAVNLAFEGRPGPVHIHVPENLTHHGVEVNYRDLRLVVKPVLPDPARVGEIADYLADAFAKNKKVVALVRFGDEAVAEAFIASRLEGDWGHAFGTLPAGTDFTRIIDRHRAAT